MHIFFNISVTVAKWLMHLAAIEGVSGSNPFCDSIALVAERFRHIPAKDNTVVRFHPRAQQGTLTFNEGRYYLLSANRSRRIDSKKGLI